MRTNALDKSNWEILQRLLTPANALVVEIMLETGLRISDVVSLKKECAFKTRFTVEESKTGKKRNIRLSKKLREKLQVATGDFYIFPNARNPASHRTRQAVWHDIKRASKAMRFSSCVAPHSCRKSYAVDLARRGYTPQEIQKRLNHDNLETTILYLLDYFKNLP